MDEQGRYNLIYRIHKTTQIETNVPYRTKKDKRFPYRNVYLNICWLQAVVCPSGEPGHEGDQLQPEQEGPDRGEDTPPPLRVHGQARQAHQETHLQVVFFKVKYNQREITSKN